MLLHFEGCLFESNSAKYGPAAGTGDGGALSLLITPSTKAVGGAGADAGAMPPAVCSFLATALVNNSAGAMGGAIEATFPPDTPANLRFTGDSCTGYVCTSPLVSSANTPPDVFAYDTARLWHRSVELQLVDMAFDGNSAGTDGGALAVTNGATAMANVTMAANSAGKLGGALFLSGTASLNASATAWLGNIVDELGVTSSAYGQHIYADAGAGSWNFSGGTSFAHADTSATGLSAAKTDGVHGLYQESVVVTCPAGAEVTEQDQWVTTFTASSPEWGLSQGQIITTTTGAYYNSTVNPDGSKTCNGVPVPGNDFCQLPSNVTTQNRTMCEAEYFSNFMCGNPPPVNPPMSYEAVSLGCRQCDRSEAALPAAAGQGPRQAGSASTLSSKCERCPEEWRQSGAAECDTGLVAQARGWWRPEGDGTVTKDTQFWQCFSHETACVGSKAAVAGPPAFAAQCREGHTGPVCALCKHGYAMSLRRCEKCTGDAMASAAIAAALFATLIGGCWLLYRWRLQLGIKKKFITTAKIVLGFYSLLVLVTETFSIVFPAGFHAILVVLQAVFSSIGDLSTFSCALPVSAYGQLMIWCGLLFLVLGGIGVSFQRAVREACLPSKAADDICDEPVVSSSNGTVAAAVALLSTEYNGYAFNAALVFYPFVSRAAIAVFKCREVDGMLYLEIDYNLQCEDEQWYWAAAGSTVVCLAFVFGLPLYVANGVWSGDGAISFYTEGYRAGGGRLALGWEVLEMVRKFLLTSAVLFLDQGSVRQVASALVVSVLFLVLHVRVLPFEDSTDNWLQGVALVALCIVYFAGLIIKTLPATASASSFDSLLQLSSVAVVLIVLTVPAFRKVKSWCRGVPSGRRLRLQDGGDSTDTRNNAGLFSALLSTESDVCSDQGGYALMMDDGTGIDTLEDTQAQLRREQEDHAATQAQFRREQEDHAATQAQLRREQKDHAATQAQLRELEGRAEMGLPEEAEAQCDKAKQVDASASAVPE
jgi:predicted outer membrane repeat protein